MSDTSGQSASNSEFLAFQNRLRVLHSIDLHELVDAGAIESGDVERWKLFQWDPVRFLLRTDDNTAERIWGIIDRRHADGQRARGRAALTARRPDLLNALKACREELAAYREAIKGLVPTLQEMAIGRRHYDSRLARLDALIGKADAAILQGGAVAARLAHNQEVGGSSPPPATSSPAPDLLDGCNALLGLITLVLSRDDITPGVREALTNSHRIDEARAAVAAATSGGGQ